MTGYKNSTIVNPRPYSARIHHGHSYAGGDSSPDAAQKSVSEVVALLRTHVVMLPAANSLGIP